MPFEELAAFVRPGIDLPIAGRVYYVPPPNARDGLWLQALMDGSESLVLTRKVSTANRQVLSDAEERTLYQLALGPAFEEMSEAGVAWPVIKHAGMTAWLAWTRGEDVAEAYWARLDEDGRGKADQPEAAGGSLPAGSPPAPSTPTPA